MADEILSRDSNRITVLGGITDDSNQYITMLRVDPTTKRLLVSVTGVGAGTVTDVSVVTANGISGSVATSTTTPAITLSLGNITPSGVQISGLTASEIVATDASKNLVSLAVATYPSLTELSYVKGVTSAIQTQLNSKGAGTVTAVSIATANGFSGSSSGGATPALTIVAGAITPTSVNGLTISTTTGTFTLTNAKTLSVTNTLTLSGTDGTTMTFPSTSATIARTDAANTFTGVQTMTSPAITTANLSGTQLLAESASIGLDPAGSADGAYSGITMTATAGYTQAFGDLVYLSSVDSRWEAADADAATTGDRLLAMVVVAGTDGNACTLLMSGTIRADAKFPALTIGSAVYVGEAAGEIQVAIPTGADNVIRRVGYALTADSIYFNPSMDSQITVA